MTLDNVKVTGARTDGYKKFEELGMNDSSRSEGEEENSMESTGVVMPIEPYMKEEEKIDPLIEEEDSGAREEENKGFGMKNNENAKKDAQMREELKEEHRGRVTSSMDAAESQNKESRHFARFSQTGEAEKNDHTSSPRPRYAIPQIPEDFSAPKTKPRARRMKVSVTKVDAWSVAKVTFLLTVAGGIIQVVASGVIWELLNLVGVFDKFSQIVSSTGLSGSGIHISDILSLPSVLSFITLVSVGEIVLITLVSTILALIYNVVSVLVGGIHVTLGDD